MDQQTPSPGRNTSSDSDRADWDKPSVGLFFSGCLAYTAKTPPMAT